MKNLILCDLSGGHNFLNAYPLYVYALIYVFFYSLLLIGRWHYEGRAYDIAYSSKFGCLSLAIFVIIGAGIIQQENFHPANWIESRAFHLITIFVSIVVAFIFIFITRPKEKMDRWFALVDLPLLFYFVITVIPIYWYGNVTQKIVGFLLLLLWLIWVIIDIKNDRLDQRKWLRKNRPNWKFID